MNRGMISACVGFLSLTIILVALATALRGNEAEAWMVLAVGVLVEIVAVSFLPTRPS